MNIINIQAFDYEFIESKELDSEKLMIVMHGLGDSTEGYLWLPEMLNIKSLNYLLLNAPDKYYDGFSWYDYEGNQGEGIVRSRELLFDLLDELKDQGLKTENMILLGFSQGCVMCYELGLRYPEKFAGICGISGYLAEPHRAAEEINEQAPNQNWLITHGLTDEVISHETAVESVNFLKEELNVPVELNSFFKPHTIDLYEELPLIKNWLIESLKA